MDKDLKECPFDESLAEMAKEAEHRTTKKDDGDDDYDRIMWNMPEEEQP